MLSSRTKAVLESVSRLTKRIFGKFSPWEVRELGVDTWTALPINLPGWAEIERHEPHARVSRSVIPRTHESAARASTVRHSATPGSS